MACIEIKAGNQTYKITNDDQSEVYNSSDWDLIQNFMTRGVLPVGYYVEGGYDRETILDSIINGLADSKTNTELYQGSLVAGNTTMTDFINKTVGNAELNAVLDLDERYFMNHHEKNALVLNSWGDKYWLGFTKDRALLLTGNKFFEYDRNLKSLYRAYGELKTGSERIEKIVNGLYKGSDTDIFAKFTELANNQRGDLIASLFVPYGDRMRNEKNKILEGKALWDYITEDASRVKGRVFKIGKKDYIFKSMNTVDDILADNIIDGKEEIIPLKSIKQMYNTFTLSTNGNNYMLIGKNWYNVGRNRYTEITDELKNKLFETWFGINPSGDKEVIVLYSDKFTETQKYHNGQDPVYPNTLVNGQELRSLLPNGSYIQTSSGIYIKEDDEFTQGERVLSDGEKINRVTINSTDTQSRNILMSLKNVEPEKAKFSDDDIRIILSDHFGLENFDNVFISYKQSDFVRVNMREVDEVMVPILQIGLSQNQYPNAETFADLKLAVNYLNYLNDDSVGKPAEVTNPREFWKILKDVVIYNTETEVSPDVENVINILKNGIDDPTDGEILENVISENRMKLISSLKNTEDLDPFMEELMNKGFIVNSCEL